MILPPGRDLDALVAARLGVETESWCWEILKPDNSVFGVLPSAWTREQAEQGLAAKISYFDDEYAKETRNKWGDCRIGKRCDLEFKRYSTDPSSPEARDLAFAQDLGWAVVIPKGDEFWCYMNKGGAALQRDRFSKVGIDGAYLAVGVDDFDTVGVGTTPAHAVALAIAGAGGER